MFGSSVVHKEAVINDTGGNFATGINGTGGKFAFGTAMGS
jgi:hypothetical protein